MNLFSPDFLDQIKLKLLEDKKQTSSRIAELKIQDPFRDVDRINDNAASDTDASEESSHDRVTAQIDELTVHLNEIDQALGRIETDDYGYCVACHNPIAQSRISFIPSALYCIDCESKKANLK